MTEEFTLNVIDEAVRRIKSIPPKVTDGKNNYLYVGDTHDGTTECHYHNPDTKEDMIMWVNNHGKVPPEHCLNPLDDEVKE